MIRVSLHRKDMMILNLYVSNCRAPKYMRQKLTEKQGEANEFTLVVVMFPQFPVGYDSFSDFLVFYNLDT